MENIKGKVEWIDIESPSTEILARLKETYSIHSVIIEELKGPSARAHVEVHPTYLYLIYYVPIYDPVERVSRRSEVDFIITAHEVITVRYDAIEPLHALRRTLRPTSRALEDTLALTHKILETLKAYEQRQLTHIREKIEEISQELFRDREKERERTLLEKISYLKRDISQYRLIVRPQKQILESFFSVGCKFLGGSCEIYLNDLIGEHIKVLDQLEDYRQAVEDFETTNIQLITIKNTEIVKTFTIMAFLTFPMMLFAALFSMNTKDTPIIGQPNDFWMLLGIVTAAMLGMYLYFRKKDWL